MADSTPGDDVAKTITEPHPSAAMHPQGPIGLRFSQINSDTRAEDIACDCEQSRPKIGDALILCIACDKWHHITCKIGGGTLQFSSHRDGYRCRQCYANLRSERAKDGRAAVDARRLTEGSLSSPSVNRKAANMAGALLGLPDGQAASGSPADEHVNRQQSDNRADAGRGVEDFTDYLPSSSTGLVKLAPSAAELNTQRVQSWVMDRGQEQAEQSLLGKDQQSIAKRSAAHGMHMQNARKSDETNNATDEPKPAITFQTTHRNSLKRPRSSESEVTGAVEASKPLLVFKPTADLQQKQRLLQRQKQIQQRNSLPQQELLHKQQQQKLLQLQKQIQQRNPLLQQELLQKQQQQKLLQLQKQVEEQDLLLQQYRKQQAQPQPEQQMLLQQPQVLTRHHHPAGPQEVAHAPDNITLERPRRSTMPQEGEATPAAPPQGAATFPQSIIDDWKNTPAHERPKIMCDCGAVHNPGPGGFAFIVCQVCRRMQHRDCMLGANGREGIVKGLYCKDCRRAKTRELYHAQQRAVVQANALVREESFKLRTFCQSYLWAHYCLLPNGRASEAVRELTAVHDQKGKLVPVHEAPHGWTKEVLIRLQKMIMAAGSTKEEEYLGNGMRYNHQYVVALREMAVWMLYHGGYRGTREKLGLLAEVLGLEAKGTIWDAR